MNLRTCGRHFPIGPLACICLSLPEGQTQAGAYSAEYAQSDHKDLGLAEAKNCFLDFARGRAKNMLQCSCCASASKFFFLAHSLESSLVCGIWNALCFNTLGSYM